MLLLACGGASLPGGGLCQLRLTNKTQRRGSERPALEPRRAPGLPWGPPEAPGLPCCDARLRFCRQPRTGGTPHFRSRRRPSAGACACGASSSSIVFFHAPQDTRLALTYTRHLRGCSEQPRRCVWRPALLPSSGCFVLAMQWPVLRAPNKPYTHNQTTPAWRGGASPPPLNGHVV